MITIKLLIHLVLMCLTCLNAQRLGADNIICTASTPLNGGRRMLVEESTSMNPNLIENVLGRKLIAFEGGAAQQWTFETIKKERVKMMFSCEPSGFKVSIFFSKRPCNGMFYHILLI